MKMRIDVSEALSKAADEKANAANAKAGIIEAKLRLFEAQELAEKRSNKPGVREVERRTVRDGNLLDQ